jgi:hypothetical protein
VRGWSFIINILFLELIIKRLTSTLYVIIYYYRHTMLDQEIKCTYVVHDCFKHAGGHDIFLLDWRQVLSYVVSLLNIRLVVNSLIDLV